MEFPPLALVASFTFAFCLSYFASRENQEYRATRLQALRRAQPATQTISASTLPPVLVGAPPSPVYKLTRRQWKHTSLRNRRTQPRAPEQ